MEIGVRRLCVCDTCGHVTPNGVKQLLSFIDEEVIKECQDTSAVKSKLIGTDTKTEASGVANNLAAVEAGADVVHGTALGGWREQEMLLLDQTLVNLSPIGNNQQRPISYLSEYVQKANEYIKVPLPRNYPCISGRMLLKQAREYTPVLSSRLSVRETCGLADRVYGGVPAGVDFGLEQVIRIGHMSGRSNIIHWLESNGMEATDELSFTPVRSCEEPTQKYGRCKKSRQRLHNSSHDQEAASSCSVSSALIWFHSPATTGPPEPIALDFDFFNNIDIITIRPPLGYRLLSILPCHHLCFQ